jgi:hypothetical protein
MAIVINKPAVRRALEQWFIAARAGHTLGAVETAKLSAADAAAQSSDFVFELLCNDEDSQQYVEPAVADEVVSLRAGVAIEAGMLVIITSDGTVLPAEGAEGELPDPEKNDDAADFF